MTGTVSMILALGVALAFAPRTMHSARGFLWLGFLSNLLVG